MRSLRNIRPRLLNPRRRILNRGETPNRNIVKTISIVGTISSKTYTSFGSPRQTKTSVFINTIGVRVRDKTIRRIVFPTVAMLSATSITRLSAGNRLRPLKAKARTP